MRNPQETIKDNAESGSAITGTTRDIDEHAIVIADP